MEGRENQEVIYAYEWIGYGLDHDVLKSDPIDNISNLIRYVNTMIIQNANTYPSLLLKGYMVCLSNSIRKLKNYLITTWL